MVQDLELKELFTNIVHENNFSNCRLCLNTLNGKYVQFENYVSHKNNGLFISLRDIMRRILGDHFCEDIPGIDAVCNSCVDKAITTFNFIESCEKSTKTLTNIFDNINHMLNYEIESVTEGQSLYLVVGKSESQLVLLNKDIDINQHLKTRVKIIKCAHCNKAFNNEEYFKEHNTIDHKKLTCDSCLETLSRESDLNDHYASEDQYKCKECGIVRCTEESLKRHQDKVHKLYVCKDCGKSVKGLDKLHAHEQRHVVRNKCPKCGKSYITKEFFSKHVKLCLENKIDPHPMRCNFKKSYTCKECGKAYSTLGGLQVHNRFYHGNAQPHVCKYCKKIFTAPSYLRTHMITHTKEKNFKCDICGNRFVSKEALLYHTRRHTGEKPYKCSECDEKFVNASARAEHIKFKHVGPTLMCEICSRKFVTSTFLKLHIKKHHDPTNKLYSGRSMIPANIPAEQNMRVRICKQEV